MAVDFRTDLSHRVIAEKGFARRGEATRAKPFSIDLGMAFLIVAACTALCLAGSTQRDAATDSLAAATERLEAARRLNVRLSAVAGDLTNPDHLKAFAEGAGMEPAAIGGVLWCPPAPRMASLTGTSRKEAR